MNSGQGTAGNPCSAAPSTSLPVTRRSFVRTLVGITITGLASACTPLVGSPTPIPTRPPRRAAAGDRPEPQSGGTLVYGLAAAPDSLDPANALTVEAEVVGRAMFDGLVELGRASEPRPALAERWELSRDGLRYTFFLRQGVTFHDGTVLDARAAQISLERLLGEERPAGRGLLAGIVNAVRATDERRLELRLERPFSTLLHRLAQFGAAIVSPAAHRAAPGELGRRPVGSGPFRFAGRGANGELRLERWDAGWRGKPLLDQVVFRAAGDENARLALLEADEIQLSGPLGIERAARLEAGAGLAAEIFPSNRVLGIAINTQASPLNDRRIRQALNYAVDKDALARTVFGGHATPLGGPLAPSVHAAARFAPYPHDPERARRLLDEAGFPGTPELPLVGSRDRFPGDAALVEEVRRQLAAVGVRTRLELLDPTHYTATITKAADETPLRLSLVGWLPRDGDPRTALFPPFHSGQWMSAGHNTSFFKNQTFDDLLERATRAPNPDERDRLFLRAQELLRDEAPWIFLLSPLSLAVRAETVHEPLLLPSEVVSVSERTWLEG